MLPQDIVVKGAHLIDLLRGRGMRLAMAESCTGGLIGAVLTEVAGASDVFECGFVTYSDAAKTVLLGVPGALIAAHGAVSREVAEAMVRGARGALGVRGALDVRGTLDARGTLGARETLDVRGTLGALDRPGADMILAVTGIAGPGGGGGEKSVGLVHVAGVCQGKPIIHRECRFGDIGRRAVRLATVEAAFALAETLLE